MISRSAKRSRLAAAVMLGAITFAAPHALANETVALKNALYGAGYEVTNVSPQMDEATRSALTEFQRDQGLNASGELDDATKEALGMVSVQVASSGSGEASQKASPATNDASEPESEQAQTEEGDIEEDDDGGWSLW
ncbi:peptidoglycan-binding domain-containing protein [Marinobacter sp. TBZ242]|uniref:Peptidoglycan-binding domain-containing protein n=1 Tax=Marinobacter azerbaijanicus TaxID=3050455 RepID=A0ABT7IAJ1_9GAMM|nr:peptidoglycan-binding domain-containing protein [Marinobacter sp. TBZ242]MDL0430680.1 peptidoglycan-binding domain-containing protein [Marinobacter sp. TBZ242]